MDRRFLSIGDLPSNGNVEYDFDTLFVRPFEIGDITSLYTSISQQSLKNVMIVLQHCISEDISKLTDGDMMYAMGWIRMLSYPKSSVVVTWTCHEPVVVTRTNKIQLDPRLQALNEIRLRDRGFKWGSCETKNTVPLTNVSLRQIRLPANCPLPEYLDYPRVDTLIEYDEEYSLDPAYKEIARYARWVKNGNTLKQKIKEMNRLIRRKGMGVYHDIIKLDTRLYHGIKDVFVLDCRRCDKKTKVENNPDFLKFFSITSEESILNMQFNLANAVHISTTEDTPAKKLLYWHSCYEKDLQEKDEKRRMRESQKGRR